MLAALSSYLYLQYLRGKFFSHIPIVLTQNLFIGLYLCAYSGSRLYSIFFEQKIFEPLKVLQELFTLGAMSSLGGIIACLAFGGSYLIFKRQNLRDFINLLVPPGLLGLAIGRVGCFFNGCDCGIPVAAQKWWTVSFAHSKIPRVPIQLIEAFCVFVLVFLLYRQQKKRVKFVGMIGIICYACFRFLGTEGFKII